MTLVEYLALRGRHEFSLVFMKILLEIEIPPRKCSKYVRNSLTKDIYA